MAGQAVNPQKEPTLEEILRKVIAENTELVNQHKDFQNVLTQLSNIALHSATSPRSAVGYYNKDQQTIQAAGANPPVGTNYSPDDPAYSNHELIYDSLHPHRNAPKVQIINDGTSTTTDNTLYVIASSNGGDWTPEATIKTGEARAFYNAWELRLRSPTIGVPYRVTEWDIWLPYSKTIISPTSPVANRALFTAQNVAVPFPVGALLPSITVPDGFSLVVTANVNNTNQVYIAGPIPGGSAIANVAVAATRNTLKPGDVIKLYITNADIVAILDSAGLGDTVDILVEQ
jgi:hypothetical protein